MLRTALLQLALVLVATFTSASSISPFPTRQPTPCSYESIVVAECEGNEPVDLLILLDTSASLDRDRFYTTYLDFVQELFCMNSPYDKLRAGLISFSQEIVVRIPLQKWTPQQWFEQVDVIRNNQSVCCSCCTPQAEAFELARTEWDRSFAEDPKGKKKEQQTFMITDGIPFQQDRDGSKWAWNPPSPPNEPTPAQYTYQIVPEQSGLLKDDGRRVLMLGIPNKSGNTPRTEYFAGHPDPSKSPSSSPASTQCIERGIPDEGIPVRQSCADMLLPPFPIVSEPTEDNIFVAADGSLTDLINSTILAFCDARPTPEPTTLYPTLMPTPSPTVREVKGVDIYYIIDRSRSMRWVPNLCRNSAGGNPQADDKHACWEMFLNFVSASVQETVNLKIRGTDNTYGWYDSHPNSVERGVRVWLYGFACKGGQSEPIAVTIAEAIGNQADFNAAIAEAALLTPGGGTCPSLAMNRAVEAVQNSQPNEGRQFKTAPMLTDFVFYDMPAPREAAGGLWHFGVVTYSMIIAAASPSSPFWLNRVEQEVQDGQSILYVENDKNRIFNLADDAFDSLDEIAKEWALQLEGDLYAIPTEDLGNEFYCGWTTRSRCLNRQNSEYCKWRGGQCRAKTNCNYSNSRTCRNDPYCFVRPRDGMCLPRNN